MKQSLLLGFFVLMCTNIVLAQQNSGYKSWNPEQEKESVIGGQGWHTGLQNYYDRFPEKAKGVVRKDVWNLSKNSAGLNIRFKSDASEIIVKYVVSGSMQMAHMPATGVSGIDLYAQDANGKWLWASANYSFGDTVKYRFANMKIADREEIEYTLYLPLYNSVKGLQISVPEKNTLTPLPVSAKKPIVVYGTSIAQGACATRPGLAWTSILSRKLNLPIINLGFSGNGRLEKEVYELFPEIDASLYVLDCLPNLTPSTYSNEEIVKRIIATVAYLQQKKPGVPILLADHDGYTDEGINPISKMDYERVNVALKTALSQLKANGVKGIYHLSKAAINQDIESTVDGVHPNDIGMMNYANAYERIIKKIL
ncbi:SGNH/GDSL hydrolase family protein [Pedobacter nyackensis]|uniref:SGNH/GDSL hydrolase family protein n=1 Tax=Pedobacter nyackensis TaxID=475255 RepID=UPI00292E3576|nr:SGNH/GDSL hydrolase family protein [Pedobacter nyackensis]